jgi:hypothetical protein
VIKDEDLAEETARIGENRQASATETKRPGPKASLEERYTAPA